MAFAHGFPFDPTYGYDLPALLRVGFPPPPVDFEKFWRSTYDQATTLVPNMTVTTSKLRVPARDVYDIEFDGIGDFRVGGWLTVPADGGAFDHAFVCGHGYAGRERPDEYLPGPPAAALYVCARGFDRSASRDYPGAAVRHVISGIRSRETYIHRFCVADFFTATTALLERFPHIASRVRYLGASFGGGLGALALAWEPRWSAAFLDVPSFGNHPIRVTLPGVGSGESVRQYRAKHPEIDGVLPYFDAATAASFATTRTLVAAAKFDPAVMPPGQFAVCNALAGKKDLFVREAAHFDWAECDKETTRLHAALDRFFADAG